MIFIEQKNNPLLADNCSGFWALTAVSSFVSTCFFCFLQNVAVFNNEEASVALKIHKQPISAKINWKQANDIGVLCSWRRGLPTSSAD